MAFNFQQVVIPIVANVQQAITGLGNLQNSFQNLAKTVHQFNNQVTQNVNGIPFLSANGVQSFERIDNSVLRVIDRMSRFLTAVSSLKDAVDLVGQGWDIQAVKLSNFVTAGGEGLRVFSNLALLAKDRMGQFAAGLVGVVAAALFYFVERIKEAIAATNAATDATDKMLDRVDRLKNKLKDISQTANVFLDPLGVEAQARLSAKRSEYESTLQDVRDSILEIAKLKQQAGGQSGSDLDKTNSRLDTERTKLNRLVLELRTIEQSAFSDLVVVNITKYVDQISKLNEEFYITVERGKAMVEIAKLLEPGAAFGSTLTEDATIKATQSQLNILQKQMEEMLVMQDLIEVQLANAQKNGLDDEARGALKAQGETNAANLTLIRGRILKAQEDARAALAGKEFTKAFTDPLFTAISNSVIEGIVAGKKGVEILADFMNQLFKNALDDVMKHLQVTMTQVFKDVAGAGGEILGSVLTAAIGIVAGVLGRRRSSSDTFAQINSVVESTQAVRGIVTGPTNVAIATVGDSIARANRGVEQRLDIMIQLLSKISDSSSLGLAGTVATP